MMNYIWAVMVLLSLIVGACTGRLDPTVQAGVGAASGAIGVVLGLAGIMCLWTGIMKIAERSGMVSALCRIAKPVARVLFPDIPPESPAMNAIMLNITANLLGMGNAATPMGLNAMAEMHKLNRGSPRASNAMCMFVVLNTASIQLIPSTIIAIRGGAQSVNPFEVILPIWITSICGVIVGIIFTFILQNMHRERKFAHARLRVRRRS